ncbi:peptidoglycan-binding protein [Prosthecomicrobium hirschii]|uniref:peptidoglycan-binding protein n=1 Tax=Prosthecodimorpha hirschii TaxID=665126 RepID=UPI0022208541|nr:peptidoglycan-binding protein [Prosthecomicrobium hirschii]MCW1839428.1 peptidoglycan-binding protein [Prosthecomicrobium hirschii]MCW1844221.1 peptidoglycan-binding protein [Prosthecomicrobium hirschii]
MRAVDIARRLCRRARPEYLEAFDQGDALLDEAGINTPLRLAHFLAQIFHECGGLTILREDMRYSAARIREVWPSRPEAVRFAGDPQGLANCVYANRMGNGPPESGDGWNTRGNGFMQTTGVDAHRRYGARCGVDFVADPDLLTHPDYALQPALLEWSDMGCNALADRNAIKAIGNAINRGNPNAQKPPIGHEDRVAWFDRIWALMQQGGTAPAEPSWRVAEPDPDIADLQRQLVRLGYAVVVDGRKGPKTVTALQDFQRRNKLAADGVAGAQTRAALHAAIDELDDPVVKAPTPPSADQPPIANPGATGTGVAVGGGAAIEGIDRVGQIILDQKDQLGPAIEPIAAAVPWVKIVLVLLTIAGVGLMAYGAWLKLRPRAGTPL